MKTISTSPDGGRVLLQAEGNVVVLRGEIDHASPKAFLAPFFEEVHKAALAEGLRAVRVDVRGLRFLNSSAVKEIIGWVLQRNRMPPGTKYAIEFVYDSTILWQRVTMPTISHLDAEFIMLDDRGRPTAGNA
jgi:hypothetical protein